MRGEIVTGGAGGSATLNLNKGNFAAMPVLIPTEKCMGAFHVSVKPVFDHILVNEFQSQSLGSIRDTLLPKLLSGQVRVKDAEKLVGKLT
jgi:type I restriction enzyme S subunit